MALSLENYICDSIYSTTTGGGYYKNETTTTLESRTCNVNPLVFGVITGMMIANFLSWFIFNIFYSACVALTTLLRRPQPDQFPPLPPPPPPPQLPPQQPPTPTTPTPPAPIIRQPGEFFHEYLCNNNVFLWSSNRKLCNICWNMRQTVQQSRYEITKKLKRYPPLISSIL